MSAKISALPSLAKVHSADLFTAVAAALNYSVTRDVIMTAWDGDFVALEGYSAFISIVPGGVIEVSFPAGATYSIIATATTVLTIDASTNVLYNAQTFEVDTPVGSKIQMDALGNIAISALHGQQVSITYLEISVGIWGGSGVPRHYDEAVRRLAAAVEGLLGGPIP
jgi:hypothetical protein